MALAALAEKITLRLPEPHKAQEPLYYWNTWHPKAQVLVAPCGTKVGKSFGSSMWLLTEALSNPRSYCVWIAPTKAKARIGFRYMKHMLPKADWVECVEGKGEIRLANGSVIYFLHGHDAEVTVEGEAVDRFVIDEAGKINKQVWYSLLTTITQTGGKGIVTGTPRGFGWYYDMFKIAKRGDNPFFCWAQVKTEQSPYVNPENIANAKALLPKWLFDQYYNAMFTSQGTVFGDLTNIWDETLEAPIGPVKYWIHPDPNQRTMDTWHGVDIAKVHDYTVFYSVNENGVLTGFCRFRKTPYPMQTKRLKMYLQKYFSEADNMIRYDATGIGQAFGDLLVEEDIDAAITAVTFTQKSKAEMVMKTTLAIEQSWHKAPRLEVIEHEYGNYEVKVTKAGNFTYSAPDGEHDDVVSAGMLALSGAYQQSLAAEAEKLLEEAMSGNLENTEQEYVNAQFSEEDEFFDEAKGDTDIEQFLED